MPYITSIEQMGIEKGRQEEREAIALNMIRKQLPLETICEVTGLTIEQVQQLQAQSQN
jgi:predicted transposase/invertase (TIGR01784 family)